MGEVETGSESGRESEWRGVSFRFRCAAFDCKLKLFQFVVAVGAVYVSVHVSLSLCVVLSPLKLKKIFG